MLIDHTINQLNNPRSVARIAGDVYGLGPSWDAIVTRHYSEFAQDCNSLARGLREIPKFIFRADFTRLVQDIANTDPQTIRRLFATARPPFDQCWLEWKTSLGDKPCNIGAFVVAHKSSPDAYNILIAIEAIIDKNETVGLLPAALAINFNTILDDDADDTISAYNRDLLFTPEYIDRWPGQSAVIAELGRHAAVVTGPPPFGTMLEEIERPPSIEIVLGCCGMFFREIVTALALMTTHIGGGAIIQQHRAKTKGHYARGKIRPGFEYQIIELVRPMTAPLVVAHSFPVRSRSPSAHHPVIGAWHHRRASAPNCGVHPRACPLANWVAILDEDGNPIGSQQQSCTICHRHRWFIPGHYRGDPSLGTLDRDYQIAAAKGTPA